MDRACEPGTSISTFTGAMTALMVEIDNFVKDMKSFEHKYPLPDPTRPIVPDKGGHWPWRRG
jgi:hypothetical protein